MNIDQRLEALTQSVELLAGMQVETEGRMTRLAESLEQLATRLGKSLEQLATRLGESMEQLATRTTRLEQSVASMADGMAQLTRVVLDHHERIAKLEGSQTQQ